MKFAVPTTHDNQVDAHFGHCEFFTVFTAEDGEIKNSQVVESPQGCGCKSNIATVLQEMGVKVMLAGNMGGGAVNVLSAHGIEVYRGCEGDATKLANEFVKGSLIDSGETCQQHVGHDCGNHN